MAQKYRPQRGPKGTVENALQQGAPWQTYAHCHAYQSCHKTLRAHEQAIAANGNPHHSGIKPVNMIVISDGIPTDEPESVIVSIAKRLDTTDAPLY
jgi:hypothetical protein